MGKPYNLALQGLLALHYAATRVARLLHVNRSLALPAKIVLTATFYSEDWIKTHILPLARSSACSELIFVSSDILPDIPGADVRYPPPWMTKTTGNVGSRLIYFCYVCVRERPDLVGGFHLLINGLTALFIASLIGKRSIYFCGGGPREVVGGGYATENRIFGRLTAPDSRIERQLLRATGLFNLVITKGKSAKSFFRNHGVNSSIKVIHGAFDPDVFYPGAVPATADVIFVGRLSPVKRVDIWLQAIKLLKNDWPEIRTVIVGDGPSRHDLEELASALGLQENVLFTGWSCDVGRWLRQSRIFMLTSESEGLSQAMVQAMFCGLPPVVPDVGELSDIVVNNENGFLIKESDPAGFAARVDTLLSDAALIKEFAARAYRDVQFLRLDAVAERWTAIVENFAET